MNKAIFKLPTTAYERLAEIRPMKSSDKIWLEEIKNGSRITFVYEKNGVLIGEGDLVTHNSDPDYTIANKRVYFSRLIVAKEYRRKGIGSQLVNYLIEEARKMGYLECSIGVNKDNTAALNLYRKKGFTNVIFDGEDKDGAYYKLLKNISPINIAPNHEIFDSPQYIKDSAAFSLIEMIKDTATLLVSDGKSYIICSTELDGVPAWVWTADNILDENLNELCLWYSNRFKNEKKPFFVAKPQVADILINMLQLKKYSRIGMESFECPRIFPQRCTLTVEKPKADDLEAIAQMIGNFQIDCFGQQSIIPHEECLIRANEFLNQQLAFIIKIDGKPVSMAKCGRESSRHLSINGVYTMPQYRGQGLAAAIVAYISTIILKLGKTPLLYTDLSNPSSNKAYINVGFLPRGKVDEIRAI